MKNVKIALHKQPSWPFYECMGIQEVEKKVESGLKSWKLLYQEPGSLTLRDPI